MGNGGRSFGAPLSLRTPPPPRPPRASRGPSRRALRTALAWLARLALLGALGVAATILALAVTPRVPVEAFGQVVQVGAVPPSAGLGLSGPGQADLFGEGPVDTVQHFSGPVRPLIVWQRFNRNAEAADFLQSSSSDGRRVVRTGSVEVGRLLAEGWTSYFVRLLVVAAGLGAALHLLVVGLAALAGRPGHPRRHAAMTVASLVTALAVAAGSTGLTVRTAMRELNNITSLSDLVGTAKLVPAPERIGPGRSDVDVVVIGDSTAAGIGNAPLARPAREDTACQRSADAYAASLQSASGYRTLNLACSSATISAGLLGPQRTGEVTLPPQVGVLKSVRSAATVVVSVGANDIGWSDFLRFCYGLPRCDDEASVRLFLSRLDAFKLRYAQLLQQLSDLPTRPKIVVTTYYDPFGGVFACGQLRDPDAPAGAPPGYGFGPDPGKDNQDEKVERKIAPLRSELRQMNDVLRQGAEAFGFAVAPVRFAGHELCAEQSWVQGLSDPAPFHPRAAGELAIAAAVLPHLRP